MGNSSVLKLWFGLVWADWVIFTSIFMLDTGYARHHHGDKHENQNGVTPLFGFGIGYKKITHYVPVVTFQTRKNKKKPSDEDVQVHHHNSNGGSGGSVTISGDEIDEVEINNGQITQRPPVTMQIHNLRNDDAKLGGRNYYPRAILHSREGDEEEGRTLTKGRTDYTRTSFRSNYDTEDSDTGATLNRGWSIRNENHDWKNLHRDYKSKPRIAPHHYSNNGNGDSSESSEEEMNEYTFGIGNWNWKPKRTSLENVFGFKRFIGNRPRTI